MATAVENLIADLLANRYSDVDQNLIAKVQTAILALAEIQSGLNPPGPQAPNTFLGGPAVGPPANAAYRLLAAPDISGIAGIVLPDLHVGPLAADSLTFNTLANYYIATSGAPANPIQVFDAAAYLLFDRVAQAFAWSLGGNQIVRLSALGLGPAVDGTKLLGSAGARWGDVWGVTLHGNNALIGGQAAFIADEVLRVGKTFFDGLAQAYGGMSLNAYSKEVSVYHAGVHSGNAQPICTLTWTGGETTLLKITMEIFNTDVQAGYAGVSSLFFIQVRGSGGVDNSTTVTINGAAYSVNTSVINVTQGVTYPIAANIMTVTVTPNITGTAASVLANIFARIEAIGDRASTLSAA